MIDASLSVFLLVMSGFVIFISYFLIQLLDVMNKFINVYGRRQTDRVDKIVEKSVPSIPYTTAEESGRKKYSVSDIPPEIMAPALKNPPKPAGGFGRVVEDK